MRAREFITEIFDRPWELETDTPQTNFIKNKILKDGNGSGGLTVYQKKDDPSNNIMIIYHRGCWEVHHVYDDGNAFYSGTRFTPASKGGLGGDMNIGFVATAIKLYKELLDKGQSIRVTAPPTRNEKGKSLWDSYSKFITSWINKNPNFMAGPVVTDEYSAQGNPEISQVVRPYGKKWIEESLNDPEFLEQRKTILREYKRDITLRQYGSKILNAWKTGADTRAQAPFTEYTILGLDDDDVNDENIVNSIIAKIENADPTSNKIYTPWLAREYANGNIKRIEDLDGYGLVLRAYNKYKARGDFPQNAKDIMRLNATSQGDNSFWIVMRQYKPQERDAGMPRGNAETVYDDSEVRVIHPKDEAAACYYGQGTRWCTAATQSKNYFDDYNRDGPLYILIPKKPKHEGEKYQIHFESGQFMNENDDHVGIGEILRKRFPQLIPVFKELGEPLDDYIPLLTDEGLLNLFRVGAKLIVDNITDRLVDSGYKEIPVQYYKDQAEEWFSDYRTAGNIRAVLPGMANEGDEIDAYYRFPRLYKHILINTAYDYERHNRKERNPDDQWELYIDDETAVRIGRWIEANIRIVHTDSSNIPMDSIKEMIPVKDTPFSYVLLKPMSPTAGAGWKRS